MLSRAVDRQQAGRVRRIAKELDQLNKTPNVRATLKNEDSTEVVLVMFQTPADRPYKGQKHVIEIRLSHTKGGREHIYPMDPPKVVFLTRIFHPNVGAFTLDGYSAICLDILNETSKWSVMNTLVAITQSILALIDDPNSSSPLNGTAARLWDECYKQHKQNGSNETERQFYFKKYSDAAAEEYARFDIAAFDKWFP